MKTHSIASAALVAGLVLASVIPATLAAADERPEPARHEEVLPLGEPDEQAGPDDLDEGALEKEDLERIEALDEVVEPEAQPASSGFASLGDALPLVAFDDAYDVPYGTTLVVGGAQGVFANDLGDAASVELVTLPAHGDILFDPDGGFSYTPDAGFLGTDSFQYRGIAPVNNSGTTATITLTVLPPVDDPANPQYATVFGAARDTSGARVSDVAVTLVDDQGDVFRTGTTDANGAYHLPAVLPGTYTLRFVPPAASGLQSQWWTGKATAATATPIVIPDSAVQPHLANVTLYGPPVAVDDLYLVIDQQLVRNVPVAGMLGNDTGWPALSWGSLVDGPDHGSIVIASDGTFTYTRAPGFSGTDRLTYTVRDAAGTVSAPATVTFLVTKVDPQIEAVDDYYEVQQDTVLLVEEESGVLENDLGDYFGAVLVEGPQVGVLDFDDKGVFSYAPPPGFTGYVAFAYLLQGKNGTIIQTTGVVIINVLPVGGAADDPDQPAAPVAERPDLETLPATGSTPAMVAFAALGLLGTGFALAATMRRGARP